MKIRFLRDTELQTYSHKHFAMGFDSVVSFEKGEEVDVSSIKEGKYFSDMYNIILLDGRGTSDIKENIEILS